MRLRVEISEDQLRRMMEQTLIPPTNVTELDPTTVHAATSRLGDVRGSASERYQLDSMLTPGQLRRTPDSDLSARIRQYYFTSTAEGYDSLLASDARWVKRYPRGGTRTVLEPFWSEPGPVNALFAVDVLFLDDGCLWRQIAGRDGCVFEQNFSVARQRALASHLGGESVAKLDAAGADQEEDRGADQNADRGADQNADRGADQEADRVRVVIVVGAFARTSFIYGNRTHRAVGMSAGIAIGAILRSAALAGARPRVVDRFVDHEVNNLLDCDGVDRGVVALMELARPTAQRVSVSQECRR